MSPTLLITGAAGPFGQRVLHHLVETLRVPPQRLVATTRRPALLAGWAERGVTVHAADFEAPVELEAALRGAERMLLISTDALDRPGRRLAQHRNAVEAAVRAGVQHVVYTSMPRPEGSPVLFAPDHAGTEAALAASTLPGWTVLRNHWYMENLLHALPHALQSGRWFSAAGDGRVAYVARDDLAQAAAQALVEGGGRRTLTLSGARAYTTREIAARVSALTGRPIEVVPVWIEQRVQGMVAAGLPEPLARTFASLDINTAAGRVGEVTRDLPALIGRPPRDFDDWLVEHRAALAAPAA